MLGSKPVDCFARRPQRQRRIESQNQIAPPWHYLSDLSDLSTIWTTLKDSPHKIRQGINISTKWYNKALRCRVLHDVISQCPRIRLAFPPTLYPGSSPLRILLAAASCSTSFSENNLLPEWNFGWSSNCPRYHWMFVVYFQSYKIACNLKSVCMCLLVMFINPQPLSPVWSSDKAVLHPLLVMEKAHESAWALNKQLQ